MGENDRDLGDDLVTAKTQLWRQRVFCAGTLLLFSTAIPIFAYSQQPNSKPRPKDLRPDSGRFSNGVYTNEFFGFTYPLAKDWYLNESVGNLDLQKNTKPLPKGSFQLLVADRHTGRPLKERILILADDIKQYSKTLTTKDYVEKVVRAQPGNEVVRPAFETRFANLRFYRADYKASFSNAVLYKALLCTEMNNFRLTWIFAADSQAELNALVTSLEGIRFRDSRIVPDDGGHE